MKKITLLLFFNLAFTFSSYAQFPETFDTGLPATWATFIGANGEGTVENWTHNENGYMVVIWEDVTNLSEDWLVTPQVAITSTNSLLTFNQTDSSITDYNAVLTIRVSTEVSQTTHANFTIVDTQTETDVTNGTAQEFSRHTVDLSAYIGQSVYIAFVWAQDDGDLLAIDDVNLENLTENAPEAATTPTPSDGVTNVSIDESNENSVGFAWVPATTGDAASSYGIYLGSTPEVQEATWDFLGSISATAVDITGLAYSTTYYWAVLPSNNGGATENTEIWSFTTEADPNLSTTDNTLDVTRIFPNPVKDFVQIKTQEVIDNVIIVNQIGQQVLHIKKNQIINKSVDLSTLIKGMYFMTIKAENKSNTVKIIKE